HGLSGQGHRIIVLRVVKYVVFYESADDVGTKAAPHFPAHRARYEDFHARGVLVMLGTFARPQEEGSMAVFTTREAAEGCVRGGRRRGVRSARADFRLSPAMRSGAPSPPVPASPGPGRSPADHRPAL